MSSQRNNNSGVGNNTTRLTDQFTSGTGSTDSDKPLKAYVTVVQERIEGNTNNETWTCNYCGGTYKGSYSRIKHHLLREKKKGIAICTKVTDEYEAEMRELETIATEKARRVQVPFPNGTTSLNPPIDTNGLKITHLFIAWLILSIQDTTADSGWINPQTELRRIETMKFALEENIA
ncbi:hypothetical protein P8452_31745 [Trifolium repens]|nr:hypothetical protein P8452_31745 [Trifolium repens]